MTDQGARCPQCQVTFRVTPPQLQAAGGRVRCGFCLAVFDARANPAALIAEPAPERPAWLRDEGEWRPDDGFDRDRLRALLGPHPGSLPHPSSPAAESLTEAGEQPPMLLWAATTPTRRTGSRAGNAAILLAGSLLLALQALYFQADRFANEPRARPLYRTLCAALPCRFATHPQASDAFRVDRALVRPLPPAGLRLDAMLTNGSGRRLPLPALRIDFEDLDTRAIATRTLRPEEYLDAGAPAELAAGQSLHLLLDLYDPGPAAVSYQVTPLGP